MPAATTLHQLCTYNMNNPPATPTDPAEALTLPEAADLLRVSMAFIVALADTGQLPAIGTGTARRIPLPDLLAFRDQQRRKAEAAADELTAEAQALGLGY